MAFTHSSAASQPGARPSCSRPRLTAATAAAASCAAATLAAAALGNEGSHPRLRHCCRLLVVDQQHLVAAKQGKKMLMCLLRMADTCAPLPLQPAQLALPNLQAHLPAVVCTTTPTPKLLHSDQLHLFSAVRAARRLPPSAAALSCSLVSCGTRQGQAVLVWQRASSEGGRIELSLVSCGEGGPGAVPFQGPHHAGLRPEHDLKDAPTLAHSNGKPWNAAA